MTWEELFERGAVAELSEDELLAALRGIRDANATPDEGADASEQEPDHGGADVD